MNVILERVQDGLHIVDNKGCLHSPWREILADQMMDLEIEVAFVF